MNPFVPIFVVLGIVTMADHFTGNWMPEILALVSIAIFLTRYPRWKEAHDLEPHNLRGTTTKIFFFKTRRFWMAYATITGLIAIIWTAVATFGILK